MMSSFLFVETAYTPTPVRSWEKRDREARWFYVYVLKLNNGKFYVGQTRQLLQRIVEHQEGHTISTAGADPQLRYFEILPTREDAMRREHEMKRLARYHTRELCKMIRTFHNLISEIDID